MTSPTKHPGSGVYRIRITIPLHLRGITTRTLGRRVEFIRTLGTKDPCEARRLAPPWSMSSRRASGPLKPSTGGSTSPYPTAT